EVPASPPGIVSTASGPQVSPTSPSNMSGTITRSPLSTSLGAVGTSANGSVYPATSPGETQVVSSNGESRGPSGPIFSPTLPGIISPPIQSLVSSSAGEIPPTPAGPQLSASLPGIISPPLESVVSSS